MKTGKYLLAGIIFFLHIFLFAAQNAEATVVLPDPDTQITSPTHPYGTPLYVPGTTYPEKVASLHDDFYAYSANLNTLLGYSGFDGSVGTGNLDLLVFTGSQGANNNPVQGGFVFQNPLIDPGGSATSFSGIWGYETAAPADSDKTNGPVYADDILNYLRTFDPNLSVPVFNFDMNQTGSSSDLFMAGEVYLWDPDYVDPVSGIKTGRRVPNAAWAFDNIPNDVFDIPDPTVLPDMSYPYPQSVLLNTTPWVIALGDLKIGPHDVQQGNHTVTEYYYEANNNRGSGSLDFIAYAPTMDLSLYEGNGYWLIADFRLAGLNGGFEELFLTGAFAPHGTPVIPEPASIILFGLGLLGIGGLKKVKKI